jgi:hypothetical protein
MTRTRRCLVGAVAIAGVIFATAAAVMAQTCTLALKRRETKSAHSYAGPTDYIYWAVQPQHFYVQMNAGGNNVVSPRAISGGDQSQADAFKRIVKKEPKYQSAYPFRGVLKLGSQEYAFALDAAAPAPKPKAKKPDAKETAAKAATEPEDVELFSSLANLLRSLSGEAPAAKPAIPLKAVSYNRLYFDFNHNGDLTDDKVVELSADSGPGLPISPAGGSFLQFEFPRTDVTIDVAGTKLDYSFYLEGYVQTASNFCMASIRVSSAICREGDITLEGKRHHLVLLDYNSNGRFDDQIKISENIHMAGGGLYPEQGDMLLIDPKAGPTASDSPYDPTASDFRYDVSKMIPIDGRWYDLKISPAGDKLTLTPSTVPLGSVTNRNEAFRALIYGDKGFLKIRGAKGAPIPVPEGRWKLLSYTITRANPGPAKPAAKAEAEKTAAKKPAQKAASAKKSSVLGVLAEQFAETILGGGSEASPYPASLEPSFVSGPSLVSATATEKYKAVTVRKGETVELPFGAPYTPTVTAMPYGLPNVQAKELYLAMELVGAGGEKCTNMLVKGGRPGQPDFTITDPKGKVVQQGSFEYG